jgi:hypothetical protein
LNLFSLSISLFISFSSESAQLRRSSQEESEKSTNRNFSKQPSIDEEDDDYDRVEFEEDEEGEADENSIQYSEDFENSQLNTSSTSYKRNPFSPKVTISVPNGNRANNNNKNAPWRSLPKVSEEEPAMNTRKSTATPSGNMDSIVSNDIMELLRRESRAAFRPPELTSDPFADSIAKSFLASQVKSLFCFSLL